LLNLVYTTEFHWDGRPSTINEVWVLPYSEPQMNLTDLPSDDIWNVDEETAQERLYERFTVDVPGYVDWFMEAYSVDIRDLEPVEVWQLTGQAIAVYMRQIVSRNSEFDLWNQGEEVTLDEAAIRGAQLFSGDAGCSYCHSGPLFSDFEYHNLSLLSYDENGEVIDAGRVRVTGDEADEGKFLTPMLRSVLHTSPYFHDGGVFALEDAIRYHFSDDAKLNPLHDPILDVIPDLSDEEVGDLVAFLKSLDGEPIEQKYLTILPDMP